MTATWSHIRATMPRLWADEDHGEAAVALDVPAAWHRAWIVTSRFVVGLSAMRSRGSQDGDGADHRWRPTHSWAGTPTRRRAPRCSRRPGAYGLASGSASRHPRARKSLAIWSSPEERIERGHRVLKDRGHALAADSAHPASTVEGFALKRMDPAAIRAGAEAA
jgi:hypothetical protein